MKHSIDLVRDFHLAMGLDAPKEPTVGDRDLRALRIALIAEELGELCVELGVDLQLLSNGESYQTSVHAVKLDSEIDLVKVGHELADLDYVVQGTNVALGLPAGAFMEEVHRANMSKLDDEGKPIKNERGKIVKGPNYQPPQFEEILS